MCGHLSNLQKIALVLLVLTTVSVRFSDAIDMTLYKSLTGFRDCLTRKDTGLCFKERALDILNDTIMSDKPIILYDTINIERNPNYKYNATELEELPQDFQARNMKLGNILHEKIEEFFKSRVIRLNMAPVFEEGRAKKDKKGGGMLLMAIGGMAWMMGQLFMGKVAFLAGSALIIAKVALFLSAIVGLKKLASSGGGGESHVVYAGGDHGGWHRSLEEAHNLAYRGHMSEPTGY